MQQVLFEELASKTQTPRMIRDLPSPERPINRLAAMGARALGTDELLQIVTGSTRYGVAADVLAQYETLHDLARASLQELQQIDGIGPAAAAAILAAVELGRRVCNSATPERARVTSPSDAAALLMSDMMLLQQEEVRVISLSTRNDVIAIDTLYVGSLNSSIIRIGEIFRLAIKRGAAAIILVHNHPSGDPSPSPEDVHVTRQVVEAGELMDIQVLDHVIIGHNRYTSLKERSLGF